MIFTLILSSSLLSFAGGPAPAEIKACDLKGQPVFYAKTQETTAWSIDEIAKLAVAPEGDPFIAIRALAVDLIKALDSHLAKTKMDKDEFNKKMNELNQVAKELSLDGRHTPVERDLLRAIIRFTNGMLNRPELSFAGLAQEASWTYGFIYGIEVPQFRGLSEGQIDKAIHRLKAILQQYFFKVSESLSP